jgi:hypothetical protein
MELKQFKIHNWNCELNEEKDARISFDIQGIGHPEIFVTIFQTGKLAIEKLQGGSGSWYDIFQPLMGLVYLITDALKKSK